MGNLLNQILALASSFTGLMILIIGAFLPTAILFPGNDLTIRIIDLPITWQVSSVILCALIFEQATALIAIIAYLTIGLFYLPVFHGGGSIGYISAPAFGYLIGFIPASLIISTLKERKKGNKLITLISIAIIGVIIIHIVGIINLIVLSVFNKVGTDIFTLIYSFTLSPIVLQIMVCPSIAILAKFSNKILIQ